MLCMAYRWLHISCLYVSRLLSVQEVSFLCLRSGCWRCCLNKLRLNFYRAMLRIRIRGTSHGPESMSVCLCLSQVRVLLKRLNVRSHKQHHTIAPGTLVFLVPKISAKFDRHHPMRGRQMQVGWVKIVDFRQIAGCISKTVQDRRMVSIKSRIGSRMCSIEW